MKRIKIITEKVQMEAELNETNTANMIFDILPVGGKVNTWGEEIYFQIPVKTGPENAVEVVKEGDLAYWPDGNCFCIFFGKTPMSTDKEIRPASAVNLVGRVLGNPKEWKKVKNGEKILLDKALK
ncbi:MAG: cyclophilin-like fold protein [Elusimicrobiota bacterium]